jgi:hypothetical protein
MPVFKSLGIPVDAKHAITNGIFMAITNDIPDLIQEHTLPTNNGIGLFRWNFIHKRLEENLGGWFQSSYVSRGPCKLLFLFEQKLGFTFSIMAEKTWQDCRSVCRRVFITLRHLYQKTQDMKL